MSGFSVFPIVNRCSVKIAVISSCDLKAGTKMRGRCCFLTLQLEWECATCALKWGITRVKGNNGDVIIF